MMGYGWNGGGWGWDTWVFMVVEYTKHRDLLRIP
jgi:hypothetical protein